MILPLVTFRTNLCRSHAAVMEREGENGAEMEPPLWGIQGKME